MKLLIATMLLSCLCYSATCQTLTDVATLKTTCQRCLDSGMNMDQCARRYSISLNELVDTAYNNLSEILSSKERQILKSDQAKWLEKEKRLVREESKEYQKTTNAGTQGPEMASAFFYGDVAEFVRKRVVELVKRRIKKLSGK